MRTVTNNMVPTQEEIPEEGREEKKLLVVRFELQTSRFPAFDAVPKTTGDPLILLP